MTQSLCPDCGKNLDDSNQCADCVMSIEESEQHGQSPVLATVIFILLVLGIVIVTGVVISLIVR